MKWNYILLFTIVCSVGFCKYSYSDKCYRFEHKDFSNDLYYQYYFNKNGIPISADEIVDEFTYINRYSMHSFYYHRELKNCENTETGFQCDSVIDSVWFKILNTTSAKEFVDHCDPIFLKKYADITKHNCGSFDPFTFVRSRIGEEKVMIIKMDGSTPLPPQGYNPSNDKCVWEYEILGLIPIVTLIVIVSGIVCCLIAFIVVFIVAQKHRSAKRQRLEGSLMRSVDNAI